MSWFASKPTEKEIRRQGERELRTVNRSLATDLRQLEQKEKELILQIKQMAKTGNKPACTVLAKQLVNLRAMKTKNVSMGATISTVGIKNRQMTSMNTINKAMATAGNTMKVANQQMPVEKFAQDMREFSKQNDMTDMKSEMIEETLDSIFDVDESEENKVIDQVLDEIGIETGEKLSKVPTIRDPVGTKNLIASTSKGISDQEIDRLLSELS